MARDQDECMKLAAPLLVDFHEIWHHAFDQFRQISPRLSAEYDETTVANIIRAHALFEVIRRFDGKKGFKIIRVQQLPLLVQGDKAVWRFKRVDGSGHHQNVRTQQQIEFDDQMPLEALPEEALRLTCGYQLDTGGSSIERVIIARPMGASIVWAAQVNVMSGAASWVDITPKRFVGTEEIDFRRRKK